MWMCCVFPKRPLMIIVNLSTRWSSRSLHSQHMALGLSHDNFISPNVYSQKISKMWTSWLNSFPYLTQENVKQITVHQTKLTYHKSLYCKNKSVKCLYTHVSYRGWLAALSRWIHNTFHLNPTCCTVFVRGNYYRGQSIVGPGFPDSLSS